jgi:meso-butanediol dehydrogenase / (S,S)-butanediol dehydrogenase / diacetyl reductase
VVERTITERPEHPPGDAYAGVYPASDEAAWVTGTSIGVDAGVSAIM